jgi:uncharacterized LabA/DUF88 family protein
MQKRRVVAYIDGFNFYFRRLRNKPYRWLDLVALIDSLFPDDEVVKVKYFTARISGKFDAQKPLRQAVYLRALKTIPRLEIIEGQYFTKVASRRLVETHTNAHGDAVVSAEIWDSDEKGSDVNLGSHLLNDAWKNEYDVAAVLTNDSDLAVPMRMSGERGKIVTLLHPDNNVSKNLILCSANALHIHDRHLHNAQLPDSVTLANGKIIKKPAGF